MGNKIQRIYVGTNQVRPVRGLPNIYSAVEYIESSGTQYIDSGIKPTNKTEIVNKGWGVSGMYYGVGTGGSFMSLCIKIDETNYIGRCKSSSSSDSSVNSTVPCDTTEHIFRNSQVNGFYIDGNLIGTYTQYTFTETRNFYLFGWNRTGVFSTGGTARLYYMEIYEDGTLVRDFIPCYRKSDNEIGLYDRVNNSFYTNSGTGTFTKGGDI